MSEDIDGKPTLQILAARIEAIERRLDALSENPPPRIRSWQDVVGICEVGEFVRLMETEIQANSETERQAAEWENEQH